MASFIDPWESTPENPVFYEIPDRLLKAEKGDYAAWLLPSGVAWAITYKNMIISAMSGTRINKKFFNYVATNTPPMENEKRYKMYKLRYNVAFILKDKAEIIAKSLEK